MDSGEFDPRFDPAFQPGFDPGKHRSSPRRLFGGGAPVASGSSRPSPRVEGVLHVPDEVPTSLGQARLGRGNAVHEPVLLAVHDDRQPVPLGRNPFVWALWVVSPGMVFAGFLLNWWANNDPGGMSWEGSTPPLVFLLQQSAWVMSPALIMVGLAGLLGLLFLHAIQWRPAGPDGENGEDAAAGDAAGVRKASSR